MEHLTRQAEIIPLAVLDKKITMIGAGAVGSWTSLCLAKMGFTNQTVIDMDCIDIENMNCQFYPVCEVNAQKTEALADLVGEFTGEEIEVKDEEYKGASIMGDITISAVDSMEVRKNIFENCYTDYLIDPRMSAETLLLYVINMKDPKIKESYAKTLYTDGEAVHERCTAKSTIYCANILSGLVCKAVKNIACGEEITHYVSYDMKLNDLTQFTS